MTELDIERERREFEAWYIDPDRSGSTFGYQGTPEGIHAAFKAQSCVAWLAAKRAVLGSAEPVAWRHGIEGAYVVGQDKERMQKMYGQPLAPLFAAPPAPVSAQPDWSSSKALESSCWKNPLHPMGERLQMADGAVRFRDDVIANLRRQLAAPPSTDAKDS